MLNIRPVIGSFGLFLWPALADLSCTSSQVLLIEPPMLKFQLILHGKHVLFWSLPPPPSVGIIPVHLHAFTHLPQCSIAIRSKVTSNNSQSPDVSKYHENCGNSGKLAIL